MRFGFKTVICIMIYSTFISGAYAQERVNDAEFGEVFGLRRAPDYPLPTSENDWKIIKMKIRTGDIDGFVLAARHSEDWPEEFDKDEVFDLYWKQNHSPRRSEEYKEYFESIFSSSNGQPLTGEELNAIWAQLLKEMAKQHEKTQKKDKK